MADHSDLPSQLDTLVLHGYLQDLMNAQSIEALDALVDRICREQGFEKAQYGVMLPKSPTLPPRLVTFGNWPAALQEYYFNVDFMRLDPCIETILAGWPATIWDRLDFNAFPERRAYYQDLLGFGMRGGMHFGAHIPGAELSCMSLVVDREPKRIQREMQQRLPFMYLLFAHLHQAATRIARSEDVQRWEPLSPRELECLKWAAEGKTSAETGLILNIAENTVIRHLANACRKLGASNRTHAVAKAVLTRLITPF